MVYLLLAISFSFVMSFLIVSLVLKLSHKKSWYDRIDARKIHTGNVPRLGGVGFASAFFLSVIFIMIIAPHTIESLSYIPVLLALVIILVVGVFDDFRPLTPRTKFAAQVVASLLVFIPGFAFNRLFNFDLFGMSSWHWLWGILSLVWMVGLCNAVNFIDGVDGLSGGLSALMALSYLGLFYFFPGAGAPPIIIIALVSVICGFLVFNLPLPKARLFMGDGGSQFLGFALAMLPLIYRDKGSPSIPLFYAAAVMYIPIMDTTAAVWRRLRDHRRIDSPDRLHIHHKLMNLGCNALQVDLVLYSLQIVIGVLVFLSAKFRGVPGAFLLAGAYVAGTGFFAAMHYANKRVLDKASKNE
jgi:UDP-GlcNAc:undecaprenyl-phosphate GlcNAc-1-phosphate transferase